MYRLGMNSFTFTTTQPPRQSIAEDDSYDIFKNGNFIAQEAPGRGGFEMRSNTGVRCLEGCSGSAWHHSSAVPVLSCLLCRMQDILMPCAALVWALPEVR